ncbi:MAG: metal-dependent hydrolase [Patescibacteria group bacterium]
MTLSTHFLLGAIIGKVTGNYAVGIASSVLVDIDHLQSYFTHGLLLKPKKLWKALTDQVDPYKDQRGILHNVLFFGVVAAVLIFLFHKIGIIIAIGWFGHLCLDAFDNSDYYPLYPNMSINIRGPIKYGTLQELIFFLVLVVVYFVI